MTWADARTELVTILSAIAITDPEAISIQNVYAFPPGSLTDLPAFIINPPAIDRVERSNKQTRRKFYTCRIRCVVSDATLDVAANIIDSFREASIDALDSAVRLNSTVTLVTEQRVEEPGLLEYADRNYVGFDMLLTVRVDEALGADFGP